MDNFVEGQKIVHPTWGEGVIFKVMGKLVSATFPGVGNKLVHDTSKLVAAKVDVPAKPVAPKPVVVKVATHEIVCSFEQEWVATLAKLLACDYEKFTLLMTEEQFNTFKKFSIAKWKTLAKKIGYNYDWSEIHIVACLTFTGKIKSPEEREYEDKVREISNMGGDDLLTLIKELNLQNVFVMKASGGSSVVNIRLEKNTNLELVQQTLFDACIPFQFSESGKIIECSGKLSRIKDEYQRKRKENQPWFKKDRNTSDSF